MGREAEATRALAATRRWVLAASPREPLCCRGDPHDTLRVGEHIPDGFTTPVRPLIGERTDPERQTGVLAAAHQEAR